MVKCFSKKYGTREDLSTACNPKVMPKYLSAPDAKSLHHCPGADLEILKRGFFFREYISHTHLMTFLILN